MANKKILIVDDEEDIRAIVSRTLKRHGFETMDVDGPAAALDALKQFQPDVVVSDINMPGMDGVELARWVKTHSPHTSAIMITGYATTDSAIDSLRIGVDDYIKKPLDLDQLAAAIHGALDKQASGLRGSGDTGSAQVNLHPGGDVVRLEIRLQPDAQEASARPAPSGPSPSSCVVHVAASTDAARERSAPPEIVIEEFPFHIGREHIATRSEEAVQNDLTVRDRIPFHVSRRHCAIERGNDGYCVRDLNSRLGTIVNGQRIGFAWKALTAELKTGENTLVLGVESSPYRYTVLVKEA